MFIDLPFSSGLTLSDMRGLVWGLKSSGFASGAVTEFKRVGYLGMAPHLHGKGVVCSSNSETFQIDP